MGLFDKLKSLVSDDKKDTGTIEIIAPLSGEIVNIEDVPDVVFAEKSLVMVLLSNQRVTKWSRL
ncbi:glucose-specific phosphotransferase enzyme IIA component [Escherichia coli DEC4D]|nr:glucose-specific phosphotransferase enzyme IIA component [Escherichia coli DEC4D]STE66786.1 glucose-specific PTS system EIIA component [Escherichia coli]